MAKQKKSKKEVIREYIKSIIIALIAAMFLKIFVIASYAIPTGSMKDTLLIGDALLANQFVYGIRTPNRIPLINVNIPHVKLPALQHPRRGDIIIFKYPKDDKLNYVKRCIALPGQTVEIRNGDVYVDGKPEGKKQFLKREYDLTEACYCLFYQINLENGKRYIIRHYEALENVLDNFGPFNVPEGHYFMMGDNRDSSEDGRFWGRLPYDNIVAKPLIIYFSWNKDV
jgi:signal peptidase I